MGYTDEWDMDELVSLRERQRQARRASRLERAGWLLGAAVVNLSLWAVGVVVLAFLCGVVVGALSRLGPFYEAGRGLLS